jgi:hypothetical protein
MIVTLKWNLEMKTHFRTYAKVSPQSEVLSLTLRREGKKSKKVVEIYYSL